jgi:hypothetical protein
VIVRHDADTGRGNDTESGSRHEATQLLLRAPRTEVEP